MCVLPASPCYITGKVPLTREGREKKNPSNVYDPVTWLCVDVPAAARCVGLAEANLWAACDALSSTVMQQVPRLVCFFGGRTVLHEKECKFSAVQFEGWFWRRIWNRLKMEV